jgi:GalNAc-alpha-(1->4)-GalNAc-alpha-(1->3)-diNAcBac-PP-undecaprenol alpha-1,4-N-acetyl-D-galactosaminyltransferase
MKIALVISSLDGGGAERVMATLANAWARDGTEVTLITLASRAEDVYPLDSAVERVDLDLTGRSTSILQALIRNVIRVRRLRSALVACKPDVVISFMTTVNLLTILACHRLACPVLVSERISVSQHPPRGVWQRLYRPLYRRAAAVVSQTRRGAMDLEARLKRRISVIPNPLTSAGLDSARRHASAQTPHKGDRYWVLAVGRLSAQKGFDLLIAAFSRVAAQHGQWHLVIIGEGPERAALTAQIAGLGLADRVHLPGFCDDPQALMRRTDLFVLSSRYEGMPNALLEAMAAGCPCVSFDCETGPAELIEHSVNGWLVVPEDVAALAAALERLMVDAGLRQRLGVAAGDVSNKFSVESILAQWNELITLALEDREDSQPRRNGRRTGGRML